MFEVSLYYFERDVKLATGSLRATPLLSLEQPRCLAWSELAC